MTTKGEETMREGRPTMNAEEQIRNYVKQRTGRKGLDPDEIHGLDVGCATEAVLTLTDLRTLLSTIDCYREALERIANGPERVGYHDPNCDPQVIAHKALAGKEE